ncbi:aldehyde dehydrogenase family 3 member F1-like isoform X1 [Magnolia sinica]|uniref:aldehyde dehydrogenase family 3 member F1-like isoform X1 n=1 Tax=Magnolia sinica TaxID=86752 RepID=UPI002658CD11|nr:aldehyde dehydrogenase family 3 member F1-like isoform X1 [Magnolia sinica]
MEVQVEESWEELRESFRNRRTRSAAWRKSQLRGLLRLLHDKETDIFNAMKDDLGKHPTETYRDEVGILVKSLNLTLTCLDKWMASSKVHVPLVAFPTSGEIVPEPLGVVLIFSSWNFPLGLALDPVIGAIAAGNAVLLKPSELAPACSLFLAKNIPLYLDRKAVKVVEGGATTAEQLLNKKWDKIFFTGSARVGRVIMSAAANHLTPVTLELGGKCPAILDLSSISSSRDRAAAIKRVVSGKYGLCSGQACVGIDYLIVDEKHASAVIDSMKERIKKLYGDKPWENNSMSRIVNQNHFRRLRNLIEDPAVAASIVHGGSMDEENLFIEPTILLDPPLEAEIMTEEIFGPFLPVITVKRIQDSVDFISSRPQPLAIYVFSNDETLRRQVIAETSSGGVTFNDAIIQFACDTLPFGGVGQSGFGKYHGKFSFDAFSHGKSVLRRSLKTEMSFGYPPWTDHKLPFLRAAYNFDYIGIFLLLIGLKRK